MPPTNNVTATGTESNKSTLPNPGEIWLAMYPTTIIGNCEIEAINTHQPIITPAERSLAESSPFILIKLDYRSSREQMRENTQGIEPHLLHIFGQEHPNRRGHRDVRPVWDFL